MARKIFGHTLWWWLFGLVLAGTLVSGWYQWLPLMLVWPLVIITSLGLGLLKLHLKVES